MNARMKRHGLFSSYFQAAHSRSVTALLFAMSFLILYGGYRKISGETLARWVYGPLIAEPAVKLMRLCFPEQHISVIGNYVIGNGSSLEIVRGCDGAGFLFLALAAIVATGGCWQHLMLGFISAAALVYALNEARIVALYVALQCAPSWFNSLHTVVFPGLFVLLGILGYLAWSARPSQAP